MTAKFQKAVNDVSQLPPQEQAAAFKAISSDKLGKLSTPRSREVAKAYDAYANLLVIQNNLDTPPVATAPREETGAEIAFKESKRLFDEAAAGAGELVGERMLSYINEARQQLREVSDPDLLEETAADLIANFD